MKVIVTFLEDTESPLARKPGSLLRLGSQMGKNFNIPDDFNEPLDDLKEYME